MNDAPPHDKPESPFPDDLIAAERERQTTLAEYLAFASQHTGPVTPEQDEALDRFRKRLQALSVTTATHSYWTYKGGEGLVAARMALKQYAAKPPQP
ncbi:hypothetical protein ACIO3O_36955 [Streptomyces sp. NPDC087440]|uniref:hypothetical protein n=1 Tax=Streptomyces sp. NPDC087440 TaxID=3365790 RepID=UPI00382B3F9C